MFERRNNAGSSRTPSHPARRTRTIWQCWPVPALSGLLPPAPGTFRSGLPSATPPCHDRVSGGGLSPPLEHQRLVAHRRADQALGGGQRPVRVSGRAIMAALIAGQRDPALLAHLARGSLRSKTERFTAAPTRRFSD